MSYRHKDTAVQICLCRFCGEEGEELALDRRASRWKNKDVSYEEKEKLPDFYQEGPCAKCRKLFDDGFMYWIGDCGHSGFVKRSALKNMLKPEALKLLEGNIFRMEECWQCLGMMPQD